MKFSKLPLFLTALTFISVPTPTIKAFKCYVCEDLITLPNGNCPRDFIDANYTHLIKDCGDLTSSENKFGCVKYREGFHRESRECYEMKPIQYQYKKGLPCHHGDAGCVCFEELCNGEILDNIRKNRTRPVNPHTTTEKPGPPFKCFRCGDDQFRGRSAPPCPDVFTDDPKYIVECPQIHKETHDASQGFHKCTRYKYDRCGIDRDYSCMNRDCEVAYEEDDGYYDCEEGDCDCYTELCNGKELDELIEKGEKPFNPYTTTTTTTTRTTTTTKNPWYDPWNGRFTTKMPDEDEKYASYNSAKIITFLPSSFLKFFFILILLIIHYNF